VEEVEILDLLMFLEEKRDTFAMDSKKMEQKTEIKYEQKSKNIMENQKLLS